MAPRPAYAGPLHAEPVSVELHNTVYARRGARVDGIATAEGLAAWLAAVSGRLPDAAAGADPARLPEFAALRDAIRAAVAAAAAGRPLPRRAVATLNAVARRDPRAPSLRVAGRTPAVTLDHLAGDPTDVALGAIAADAIGVLGGPGRGDLRLCGARGCVLAFVRQHPRQRWCSPGCGNRERQARHQARARSG